MRHSFVESEAMTQFLRGRDLDMMQLDAAGHFTGEHLIAGCGPVLIQEGGTSPTLVQRGATPDHPTFCILRQSESSIGVGGRELTADQVLFVPPGEKVHVRTAPASEAALWATCSALRPGRRRKPDESPLDSARPLGGDVRAHRNADHEETSTSASGRTMSSPSWNPLAE